MEFSYRISEAQYARAFKLRIKHLRKHRRVLNAALFWMVIIVILLTLWSFEQKQSSQSENARDAAAANYDSASTEGKDASEHRASTPQDIALDLLPFAAIVALLIVGKFWWMPRQIRKIYRKDPSMQGEFTVQITPQTYFCRSSAGTTLEAGWDVFDFWIDDRDLVLLVYKSGMSVPLNTSNLGQTEQSELRSTLSAVLPKR